MNFFFPLRLKERFIMLIEGKHVEARVVNLKLGVALLVLDFPYAPLVYVSKTTRLLEYMNCNDTKPSTNSNEIILFAA
jgi:hypothetical protein